MIATERINSQLSREKAITSACERVIASACEKAITSVHEKVITYVDPGGGQSIITAERINSQLSHEKAIASACEKVIASVHEQAIAFSHAEMINDQHRDDPQRSALWVYHDALRVILCPVLLNLR